MVGNYKLSAKANRCQGVGRVSSNTVDLDVFPQLQVFPSPLLIAPGCKTSIKLLGGPSQKSRRYFGLRLEND